ncbi:phospholipid/glycerol acyltransferase [Moraxella macacae 0408225]|uniref:Phospholipid/glycerol acyltransferase n=1 Tax=Moraxella macacae 0408225 TaxID=1230338 RepID=L2FA24_9GAMM|nr:lysophospholipid acyltransferase family protein [Moraxella macacae]ELA09323.1 phospholipid/glycerol acyltransferase [Moraxella macacae 0408225]
MKSDHLPKIDPTKIGANVPRRHGTLAPKIAKFFLKATGWKAVGDIPNIKKAVLLAVPHTTNMDGVYAIPTLLALDVDIKLMGKKELFKIPVLAKFLRWAGLIGIDRAKKGSTLQASIDRFNQEEQLFLGLAPEGTRKYTENWKTGFYYLAVGAGVPILPTAIDYPSKEIRFLPLFYPTGDIEADLPKIYAYYEGVTGGVIKNMSKPLQDLRNNHVSQHQV